MKKVEHICIDALRACSTEHGLVAGTHHFVDLWARDSLFATFGADTTITKKTIESFLQFQRPDGLIPYRIFRWGNMLRPNFRSVQSGGLVADGGLMTVIAAHQLDDSKFLQKHEASMQRVLDWYKKYFGDDLIVEWFQCEWADAVLKVGKTLYTNILYWKATGNKKIAKKIVDEFWNGQYFADWIDYKRHDYFASLPNMLAIDWGLATNAQADSILAYAKKYCWNAFTLETNYPAYPFWRIPLQNHLVGMADYHNRGCMWLQPGILYAVALHRVGKQGEARQVFTKISEKITEFNGVYEVYEKNGVPVKRLFYQSEHPFAWSAGLFLWAHDILKT